MKKSLTLLVLTLLTTLPALAQDKNVGYLRTKVSPWAAGVFVDGNYKGTAEMFGSRSRMINLAPGTYDVELVDPRYKTLKLRVSIEAGKTSTIRRSMEPLGTKAEGPFGELVTEGFGNSAVYLDGAYYANSSEISSDSRALLLSPGNYTMRIVAEDGATVREDKISINADETLILSRTAAAVRRR